MALDDFMDIDSESNNTESTQDNSKEELPISDNIEDYDNFYLEDGKLIRRGLLGFNTMESFDDTKKEQLEFNELLVKFWYPVFPHTAGNKLTEVGNRHQMLVVTGDDRTCHRANGITCFDITETELRKIPREVIMLDTGEYEKEEVLATLSERYGYDVTPTSTVFLHHFGSYRAMAQSAIVNTEIDRFGNREYAMLTESALRPNKLKSLRKRFGKKYITDIPEW